jgi:hypothetical protein
MSPSRFLFSISLAAAGAAGCGGGSGAVDGGVDHAASCGPGDAPQVGVVASGTGVTINYGALSGSPNRDCPDAAAPDGVISLSIMGTQSGGSGLITLCIGRPDLLAKQALSLGAEPAAQVHVIDLNGSAGTCTLTIDRSTPPTGTATSTGMCGNGGDPAGFALVLDATMTLTRTCGSTVDSVPVTLRGRVAVSGPAK